MLTIFFITYDWNICSLLARRRSDKHLYFVASWCLVSWGNLEHCTKYLANVFQWITKFALDNITPSIIWPPLGRRPGKNWICEANSRFFFWPSAKGWLIFFFCLCFFHTRGGSFNGTLLGGNLHYFAPLFGNTDRDGSYTLGRCTNLAAEQPWR